MAGLRTANFDIGSEDPVLRTRRRGQQIHWRSGLYAGEASPRGTLPSISPCIILARFRSKIRNVTFINCYAPIYEAEVETKVDFYDELQKTSDGRTRRDILIVTGDFNAKIGKDNTGRKRIMGREGLGIMNENGEMFADFFVFNNLVIGGSVFQHKDIHKGTWVSPDHRTVNQIDHITIDKMFRKSLQDTRLRRGADAASDHHLLVGQVRLKLKKCLPPGHRFNTSTTEP